MKNYWQNNEPNVGLATGLFPKREKGFPRPRENAGRTEMSQGFGSATHATRNAGRVPPHPGRVCSPALEFKLNEDKLR